MKTQHYFHLGLAVLALGATFHAAASSITVQSGGIGLNSTDTSTTGTSAAPWLINETMTAGGTLMFQSEDGEGALGGDNPTGSGHAEGKWISKTVLNNTGVDWTSFELELQAILGTPSGEGDGISFADGSLVAVLFNSSVFTTYTRQNIDRDYLNFSGGSVTAGSSVTFNFLISDNLGNDPFYLLQTPNKVDSVPEPASLALLALDLAGVRVMRRRKSA